GRLARSDPGRGREPAAVPGGRDPVRPRPGRVAGLARGGSGRARPEPLRHPGHEARRCAHAERLSFSPLQRASRGRLLALVVIGLLVWLTAIVVVGIVVRRTNDVEIGLGVTAGAFVL